MFSCECGFVEVDWIDPEIKRLCNKCGEEIKHRDKARQTSLEAYNSIKADLGERQQQVLGAIKKLRVCNNRQIAEHLYFPINIVTPRVKELRELNLVWEAYKKMDSVTGRTTIWWSA